MASQFFHKPELAVRRAIELEGINNPEAALQLLHDVLSLRRHRTWSPAYEQIMITYLNLCLKLHKSREAKDGLHQYRNLSQSQAPGSLEKVIRYLMEKAEDKCYRAKELADKEAELTRSPGISTDSDVAADAAEDGEQPASGDAFEKSPQAILLSTMSIDPAKSQRDSTLLLPSLKFLWETYRAILDILRSNSKLEHVYHSAAVGALRFCRVYKRRMEFRHLCDMLRMHLGNLRQYGAKAIGEDGKTNSKVRGWEGWTTEAIELHLQTRFAQLETASVLHRYTEGFRTVEDIYNILQVSHARRKISPDAPPPKAKLMATYYEKLTTLFWVSENYLFHGYAWYKYYTLCKEYNRSMSDNTKRIQASAVLLSALCIPPTSGGVANGASDTTGGNNNIQGSNTSHELSTTVEDDIVKQKMARMSTLLGFHIRNPTRNALIAEIKSKNILSQVPQYLQDLYYLLEKDSDPLVLVEKAVPLLDQLKQEIGNTNKQNAAASAGEEKDDSDVVDAGAVVDDTSLGRYVKPLTSVLLLKLLLNLSQAYHTVSIDHIKKLTSGLDMSFEQVEKSIVLFTQSKTLSVRIDHRSGCLRFGNAVMESEFMRTQLTALSKQLNAVNHVLYPTTGGATAVAGAMAAARAQLYADTRSTIAIDHAKILERKNVIEKRKELAERIAQEKVREELRVKKEEEAQRKVEEENRIKREQKSREEEKQRKIQQEMDNLEKKRFLVSLGQNAAEMSEEQMAQLDTQKLQKQHQDKIQKKREEQERKLKDACKKLDYLVRAIRIEELPLIKQKYDEKIQSEREQYEAETKEKAQAAKEQFVRDVSDKKKLQKHDIFSYLDSYESVVMEGREIHHRGLCSQADQKAEVDAEKAKIRRARKRKQDEEKRRKEEEERQKAEEERLKLEEEKRKRDELKREKEAKEEERRQAELARMNEERQRQQAAQESRPPPPSSSNNNISSNTAGSGRTSIGNRGGGGGGGSKYVPPSMRNREARESYDNRDAGGPNSSRFSRDGGYGGGRYDGRDRGGGGGGGGSRFGGGGDRGGFDRRGGGGGYGDRDRRGGGGYGDRDRGGGGGGYGDRDRRRGGDGGRGRGGDNDRWR